MSNHSDDHSETHDDHEEAHDDHSETHGHDIEGIERVTSPMQGYSTTQVGIGLAVFVVGLLVAFVLPLVGV